MRTIQRAYKTELALNNQQITACRKPAGAARWAYNWGLARTQESYRAMGTSPSAVDLHRELKVLKQTEVPWMDTVATCAPQEALGTLDTACAHFFRPLLPPGEAQAAGQAHGQPGVSPAQDEAARAGQRPPHGHHGRLPSCHPVAPSRAAAAQGARLPAHCCQHPLGHRERAGRTLLRLGACGTGACRTGEHWPGRLAR